MRLADFIVSNMDRILANWEAFAATQLPAAASMTQSALRDHAEEILEAVVKDLSAPEAERARAEKSMKRSSVPADTPETAAQIHAVLRAKSHFSINQLAAEYRALRASVLRLWMTEHQPGEADLNDIVHFNEAIDQALGESIDYFSAQVDRSRNLLLGTISHDLRNPLQTIQLTAQHLSSLKLGEEVSRAVERLASSSSRMQALLDDLVVFNRTKLGLGFRIVPVEADLAAVFEEELEQFRAAHPERELELEASGDTRGRWDPQRLQQLLANLLSNALKHGAPDEPVRVVVTGGKDEVRFEVINRGPEIEASVLERIFDPLTSGSNGAPQPAGDHSLGLGLYITREITDGHGGAIEAHSDPRETVFSVCLPRFLNGPGEDESRE